MKNRTLFKVLEDKASGVSGRIILVTGARQTGKTTLVKKAFPQYEYLSIEDPVARIKYAGMTAAQWQNSFPFAILDEVQK